MDRLSLIGLNHYKEKDGIFVVNVPSAISANKTVEKILEGYCDSKTVLFLSGGKTPRHLFQAIAEKKCVKAGAVGMVDERFGEKWHKNSNELMIKNTGLIEYFESQNVRFYPILVGGDEGKRSVTSSSSPSSVSIEQTSRDYDETLRFLFKYFPKTVGILGIGKDGHTAGLPAGIQNSKGKSQKSDEIIRRMIDDQSSLVSHYELEGYGQRITMTFLALSQLDLIILLVLGQEKREALRLMFADPSASVRQAQDKSSGQAAIEEIPARFYLKPEIAEKVILVTDQVV